MVHAFESGNNPTILNYGATSIKNAKYLGDYQFNLNNTIYELVKYCRKDFPELAKAAGVDPETGKIIARNARTDRFYQTYCDLCEGEQAEKFARLKFGFMFETHYKPVFKTASDVSGLSGDYAGKLHPSGKFSVGCSGNVNFDPVSGKSFQHYQETN